MAAGDALTEVEELIARVALRDRRAFEALYARTSGKLFGVCLRVLSERSAAEDALQDAYIKVWHGAGSYRAGRYSPMTWLIAVARNAAIDRLRARRAGEARRAPLAAAGDPADSAPGPERRVIAASEAERIAACLGELDDRHAEAVRGAYLEGHTYAALAERHGVPINTMRSWLRRSLVKLRECMTR